MNHGEGSQPNNTEDNLEAKSREELAFLFDADGKLTYRPELFTSAFQQLYGAYQRTAAREEGLRLVNGGKTRDYNEADYERRDAHIAAADQLTVDMAAKGIKISSYEAETIIKKMLECTNPGKEELPLLRRAFLQDVLERDDD